MIQNGGYHRSSTHSSFGAGHIVAFINPSLQRWNNLPSPFAITVRTTTFGLPKPIKISALVSNLFNSQGNIALRHSPQHFQRFLGNVTRENIAP